MPKLTDIQVRAFQPGIATYRVMDQIQPGLGVEVRPNGRRIFIFRGQVAGRRRIEVLGDHPALTLTKARSLVRSRWAELQNKVPEQPQVPAVLLTFGDLVAEFLLHHAPTKSPKTVMMYRTALLVHAMSLHTMPAKAISGAQIQALHSSLASKSPAAANRLAAVLSKLFAWGHRRDLVPAANPASRIEKARELPRTRVLSDDELRIIWNAAELEGPIYSGVVRLLILTGCRLAEIAAARWNELETLVLDDLSSNQATTRTVLRIPAGRMKARKEHLVVLSKEAVEVIQSLRQYTSAGPWIFPRLDGTGPITDSLRYGTRRLRKRAVLAQHWTHHDLRRTSTTLLARLGVAPHLVDMITAHETPGITWKVYNQYRFGPELARGWDALGAWVAGLTKKPAPPQHATEGLPLSPDQVVN